MMLRRRQFFALAVLAVTAGLAPAAAQERRLNIYNWSDYIAPETVPEFEKQTGIKVTYDVYDSNEVLETKLSAGRSGYDLVAPTASPFIVRQLAAGLHRPIDKSKLSNYGNLDPEIMRRLAVYDPGNAHAVPWMWGTTGIGYVREKALEAMPSAPLDSLALVFNPEVVKNFQRCGVMMLDSPTDVLPGVLRYLGLDPDSKSPDDLRRATDQLAKVRPFVRKFHSSEYINALATGQICVAYGFSGDIIQAASRAKEAKRPFAVEYRIPKEGAQLWIDAFVIPKDAANVDEAHAFLNYVLQPEVAAAASNAVGYATPNKAARALVDPQILNNPGIYPNEETAANLYTLTVADRAYERLRTRAWTRVKTGR